MGGVTHSAATGEDGGRIVLQEMPRRQGKSYTRIVQLEADRQCYIAGLKRRGLSRKKRDHFRVQLAALTLAQLRLERGR